MKKIIICLLCLIFIDSCNGVTLRAPSARKVEVRDIFLTKYYAPSHRINTTDRYCAFRQDWNFGIDSGQYDASMFDEQVTQILRNFGTNFKKEDFVPSIRDRGTEIFLETISERERKNNYKNCDYIIYYNCTTGSPGNVFSIKIQVFDIRTNRAIADYAIGTYTYSLAQQAEFTELMMNKWWEYQTQLNTKKQTAIECNADGCRTIKCIGDECTVESN